MSATAGGASDSPLEPVEPPGVVGEQLALLPVADVAALADLVERRGIAGIPVREVGGVDDLFLPDQLEGRGQQPLVGLAGEEDAAAPHVVARLALVRRRLRRALGGLVVHPPLPA